MVSLRRDEYWDTVPKVAESNAERAMRGSLLNAPENRYCEFDLIVLNSRFKPAFRENFSERWRCIRLRGTPTP